MTKNGLVLIMLATVALVAGIAVVGFSTPVCCPQSGADMPPIERATRWYGNIEPREVIAGRGSAVDLAVDIYNYEQESITLTVWINRRGFSEGKIGTELTDPFDIPAHILSDMLPKGITASYQEKIVVLPPQTTLRITMTLVVNEDAEPGTYRLRINLIRQVEEGLLVGSAYELTLTVSP